MATLNATFFVQITGAYESHVWMLITGVTRLDEVIDEVSVSAESECELLREHLESARTYLLGAMHPEYYLSLRLAKEALNCISNQDRRKRVTDVIGELLADEGRDKK